ncbi:MAG: cupredoxin domain-containing protein [Patescibacteria group bacterium]
MIQNQSTVTKARLFFKTSGVVVIMLAFFNISNGLNLLGLVSKAQGERQDSKVLGNNIQEIRMTQDSFGYLPNSFTIKKDIPVRWIITSKDAHSCASSIVSSQLGIRKGLKLGENIFEFTPTKIGTIRFSCGMGMYTGSFVVTP